MDGGVKALLEQNSLWFDLIQGFYTEAEQGLLSVWEEAESRCSAEPLYLGEPPRLWKTIGDEVLFEKVITDHRQVNTTLRAWIAALDRMRLFLRKRAPRLDVKSTAWLAGFPVVNKEVVLGLSIGGTHPGIDNYQVEAGKLLNSYYAGDQTVASTIDYIGPAIDTGFRLAQFASVRRFVISVGVAYILSKTTPADDEIRDFRIIYGGPVQMKGVMGGRDYPFFWIDLSEDQSLSRLEDNLTRLADSSSRDVQAYCEGFFREHEAYIFRPFIDQRNEQQVRGKPAWYDQALGGMIKSFYADLEILDQGVEAKVEREGHGSTLTNSEIDRESKQIVDIVVSGEADRGEPK